MLSIKNIFLNISDIPSSWIFEHYCNLNYKLSGQNVKIKSLFNKHDKIPSMSIYYHKNKNCYKFKDFSSGNGGEGVNLIMFLYNISYSQACQKIINDYNIFINNNLYTNIITDVPKYKLDYYNLRNWNTNDVDFWTKYNIGSKLLEQYNVKPLQQYVLNKEGIDSNIVVSENNIYGYFKNNGELYKIYQPYNSKKFLKISDYIQGTEQLTDHSNLIITSSLKDIMSIKSLNLKVDVIAPDSENSMLSKNIIEKYKQKYKHIVVLFDNDYPGIESMKKYKTEYNIIPILLNMSKDISDSIKDFGPKKVLYTLVPLLQNAFD